MENLVQRSEFNLKRVINRTWQDIWAANVHGRGLYPRAPGEHMQT